MSNPGPSQSPFSKIGPRKRSQRGSVKKRNIINSKKAKPFERAMSYAASHAVALGFADRKNLMFGTITWGKTNRAKLGHPDPDYSQEAEYILDMARRWLRRRGVTFHVFWRREVSDTLGEHLHFLGTCPEGLQHGDDGIRAYLRGLVNTVPRTAGGVSFEQKRYSQSCAGCGRPMDWQHLVGCYFLKGSTDPVRERRGITQCAAASPDKYSQDQGWIRGKPLGHPRFEKQSGGWVSLSQPVSVRRCRTSLGTNRNIPSNLK